MFFPSRDQIRAMQPFAIPRVLPGDLIHNVPVVSLITANVITIGLAVLGNWDAATVMFIYWTQSIIIGFFTVVSLLSADTAALAADLSKPIVEQGGRSVGNWGAAFYKVLLAGFFCLHYGLFHWGYYSIIVESGLFGAVSFSDPGIWLSCSLFVINHGYSFFTYRRQGSRGASDITEQFFTPYFRIIPMHLTILFGGIVTLVLGLLGIASTLPVLVLFLFLKTYTDVTDHMSKHLREEDPAAPVRFL
jgi:hypothetical protein